MTHDSTWLRRTRAVRLTRTAAPLALVLACMLLAGFASTASAVTTEMRGEWSIVLKSGSNTLEGTSLITKEPNAKEEFESARASFFGGQLQGVWTGTLEGGKASVTIKLQSGGPIPPSEFNSTEITVNAGTGTLTLSGPGTFVVGGNSSSGTMTATRIKTYKQVEEQEAKERQEQEERQARANVRGEWALTLESGPEKIKGIALITEQANAKNEFASKSALFEGSIGGTFTGTLKGGEATVTITTEGDAEFSLPPGSFTSEAITVSSASNPTSMSGTGTFTLGGAKSTGTLTATRLRSYQQIEEQEKKEREAKEKQEKEAREAKEKLERQAREKVEREAKEKAEREAREALEKAKVVQPPPLPVNPTFAPVALAAKTIAAGRGGALLFHLTNPNGIPAHGRLKVTLVRAGKASSSAHARGHRKSSVLGESSFSIPAGGSEVVKVTLSRSGYAELARHKTLHVIVTVTTEAAGRPSIGKTFNLTLHAAKSAHGKH